MSNNERNLLKLLAVWLVLAYITIGFGSILQIPTPEPHEVSSHVLWSGAPDMGDIKTLTIGGCVIAVITVGSYLYYAGKLE
jgi:hypothetical protein